MRGFPPLHVLVFAVAFALLAIPLSRLTFARLDETRVELTKGPETAPGQKVPTFIRVRFAHKPKSISLTVNGTDLLSSEQQKPQEMDLSLETALHIPPEGLEIFATVAWPEGTPPTPLTLDLEPNERDSRTQTHWSAGTELAAAYTFHWKE